EEGRDMVVMVIGDEETIRNLDKYKGYLAELADPRKTSEARAKELQTIGKPVYYLTSGMHSTETGGPEMLMELAYRLVVEETPLVQSIRKNVLTFITPVIEVDGREKIVDGVCYRQKTGQQLPTPYWGKYVAHDNNRDGMGQYLKLTQNVRNLSNEWHPTILHDLHEAATLLYVSTGTGPYNEQLDPITINEWWFMAENDVMEMTKRGVPGVWTYGFYDGWVPNYMFFLVHSHNGIGRFYEVQSYGTGCNGVTAGGRGGAPVGPVAAQSDTGLTRILGGTNYNQSREWFRPNPTPNDIRWGPRANTNIQQSAVMYALWNTGKERERFLENYWIKNKNAIKKGTMGPVKGWVIPASQHSKANAAEAVNELVDQGLEFHVAGSDFKAGDVNVKKGDWLVRGDQPFRTIADMYFAIQNYPTTNPSPYDDTGWTYQMMRNIILHEVKDPAFLKAPMTPVTKHVVAAGGINGSGSTVIVDHTGDNNLVALRYRLASTKMSAAEAPFEAAGHKFGAGSFIIPRANRAAIEPVLKELGLSAWATDAVPGVKQHDLDIPRIGYIHSWTNTQDEGWVRAALDFYKIPYNYFGENQVRKMGALRAKFDVIMWPHGGAVGQGAPTGGTPIPYQRTAEYPSLGFPDSTADTRGGLGEDGLKMLYEFVQQGGTLITEGNTSAVFPTYSLTPGLRTTTAQGLVNRGTILRGVITDATSPIAYGFGVNQLPVYFSGGTLLDAGVPVTPAAAPISKIDVVRPGSSGALAGTARGGGGAGGGGGSVYQNTQPMATWVEHSVWDPMQQWPAATASSAAEAPGGRGGFAGGGAAGGAGARTLSDMRPRVVMSFPASPRDMLLSGVLQGGENLSNRPNVIDSPIGKGHVVMFTIRPFWRWQTQGTFIMGFNALMNWNDLSAGQ
ncbi:MAG: M14 family zinc carboxypeptidase, partial [Gemmatimonadota bacterium]